MCAIGLLNHQLDIYSVTVHFVCLMCYSTFECSSLVLVSWLNPHPQGLKDDCDFHVRPVGSLESSVVCLESAANPGMFLNLTPGSTLNASKVAPSSQEAQFTVRAHVCCDL